MTSTGNKQLINSYCFVCRPADGKLREPTARDTELAASALGAP